MFIVELCSKLPKRSYEISEMIYFHIEEIWSINLDDIIENKNSIYIHNYS